MTIKTPSLLLSVLFVLATAGCASSGVQVSQEAALQFTESKTTEAEILAKMGRPTMVSMNGNMKMLMYSGTQVKIKPATFIPIVGAFAGGSDVQSSSVTYIINKETGILDKVSYTNFASGSQTGTQPAPSADTTPKYIK